MGGATSVRPGAGPIAVLLALLLTSCGDDSAPTATKHPVPVWVEVAPGQIAEAEEHGVPITRGVLRYEGVPLPASVQNLPSVRIEVRETGEAEIVLAGGVTSEVRRWSGRWKMWKDALLLEVVGTGGGGPVTYVVLCGRKRTLLYVKPIRGIDLPEADMRYR